MIRKVADFIQVFFFVWDAASILKITLYVLKTNFISPKNGIYFYYCYEFIGFKRHSNMYSFIELQDVVV